MKPIAHWMTDTHLNFPIDNGVKRKFLQSIGKCDTDIFITGDIGDGRSLENNLNELALYTDHTVYFITGNHDYYHSSFKDTHKIIQRCVRENANLVYLPDSGVVRLNDDTCIIGPEGWYDCRICHNPVLLPFAMNDFNYIEDLKIDDKFLLVQEIQKRADDGLEQLKKMLEEASKKYTNIIILSHPALFGRMTEFNSYQPFYVWYDAGCFLADFANSRPSLNILSLSGHTHSKNCINLGNLNCFSLYAEYGLPKIGASIGKRLSVTYKR